VAVAELFPGTLSVVLLDTVAVLLIAVALGVFAFTFTTRLKLALTPAANVGMVHVTEPVPPTAGLVQEKGGPAVCVIDTNVVFAGVASLSETLCASLGPAFAALIVYVMFPPAFTGSGAPLFVTERSARAMTPVVAVAELFPGHGSNVSLVAVAVLLSVVPSGVLAFTLTTSRN